MYTIDQFWAERLKDVQAAHMATKIPGWTFRESANPSFIEASLNLREGFDDLTQPIWFVAAPGAVGKSTLAKEIAAKTGAVYLDLAAADTVAGNYLAGGLVKTGLYQSWNAQSSTVLVDALDEARLRVTQSSFEDFLNDIRSMTVGRTIPLVVFGRVGVVDDSWLILNEMGVSAPIFDIEFFDTPRAESFVLSALTRIGSTEEFSALSQNIAKHPTVYENVIRQAIFTISELAGNEGARFSGYAPVLEAVAAVISRESNPAHFRIDDAAPSQSAILDSLTSKILDRESIKLRQQLVSLPESLRGQLYTRSEQMDRLAHVILGGPAPATPVSLTPSDASAYEAALQGFVSQHPFLDGTGRKASGAVFSAAITAHGLFSEKPAIRAASEYFANDARHTPNPFLIDFYDQTIAIKRIDEIPPEHVGFIYESARAKASSGEILRLTVEGMPDTDIADVEIQAENIRVEDATTIKKYVTSQAGTIKFGRQLAGVSIEAENMDLSIGDNGPAEISAPCSILVANLFLRCSDLSFSKSDIAGGADNSVLLEAASLAESGVTAMPSVRAGVEVAVTWPGSEQYPWTNFSQQSEQDEGDLSDKLKLFRRLVMAFRSHSKGELARFKDKIEHARMTGGPFGVALREKMLEDGILTLRGPMYILHPDKLGLVAGAAFQDVKLRNFNDATRKYISQVTA